MSEWEFDAFAEELGDGVRCVIDRMDTSKYHHSGDRTLFSMRCKKKGVEGTADVEAEIWQYEKEPCFISELFLDPNTMRGRGIGTQAMFLIASEMWKKGCRDFTGRAAEEAIPFWRRLGMEEKLVGGEMADVWGLGGAP